MKIENMSVFNKLYDCREFFHSLMKHYRDNKEDKEEYEKILEHLKEIDTIYQNMIKKNTIYII